VKRDPSNRHVVAYASGRDTRKAYARMIVDGKDGPRIVAKPPLLVPLSQLDESGYLTTPDLGTPHHELRANVEQRPSSAALAVHAGRRRAQSRRRRMVGTECYVVLLVGRDEFDPFFLQVKQAGASVIATATSRKSTTPAGERVVQGSD